MSQWHRANPDLCGTDADPSMVNERYRLARDELLAEGLIYASAQCVHDFQWHPQSEDYGVCSKCGAEAPEDE